MSRRKLAEIWEAAWECIGFFLIMAVIFGFLIVATPV